MGRTIKGRIEHLEQKTTDDQPLLLAYEGDAPTVEEQVLVDTARRNGRFAMLVSAADANL